ncbi:MAG: flippase-like domain-containing protein, partial [Muribaculaceae bacterium]|nr:flippase-like domain-containing protein [Muribaculaceae bacterium]
SADIHQWLIFAREFVIWVILMVSPTPGGSGLSEWIFSAYYGDIVNVTGMALLLAIVWRILTYYIYLFTGAMIVPGWIKNTYNKINHK